jgi:thioredoxin 1
MASFLQSLLGKKEPPAEPGLTAAARVERSVEPLHVSDASFQAEVLDTDKPALVDFWAPWCGPCKMIAPTIEELAGEYADRAVIAKLNTDENEQTPVHYGIMGIPTLVLFKDGREVDRVVGLTRKQVLKAKLDTLLAD